MSKVAVVPKGVSIAAKPSPEVVGALSRFMNAGFEVSRQWGGWTVKKLHKGQDRVLSDDELVLLARSLR